MAWTTPTVEIAFDHPPTVIVGVTWTDVTAYVEDISISRGRSSELSQFSAGTCSITLRNEDRRFDPEHASGPYYGKLLPKRRIRVLSGATSLFDGYVDGFPLAIDYQSNRMSTSIEAVDAFELCSSMPLPASPHDGYVVSYGAECFYRLDDDLTTPDGYVKDSSGQGQPALSNGLGWANYTGTFPLGIARVAVFSPGDKVTLPEGLLEPLSGPWSVSFWLMHSTSTPFPNIEYVLWLGGSTFTVTVGTDGKLLARLVDSSPVAERNAKTPAVMCDNLWHFYVVKNLGAGGLELWQDGVKVAEDIVPNGTFIPSRAAINADTISVPNTSFGLVGQMHSFATYLTTGIDVAELYAAAQGWPGQLSGARLHSLCNLLGWPASRRDFDAGVSLMQATPELSGSLLEAMQLVAMSEDGGLFCLANGTIMFRSRHAPNLDANSITIQATFGDGAGELRYIAGNPSQDIANIHNSIAVERLGGTVQIAEDAESIALYWRRGEGIRKTGLLLTSDYETRAMAEWLLARYRNPVSRVRDITVDTGASSAVLTQMVAREIGDRIIFKRKPNGIGAQSSYEGLIDGVKHNISLAQRTWQTVWNLAPVEGSKVFVFNDADRGRLGAYPLGY